ncbi:Protein of unknown function [Marininema mesophilum]|uniref:Uncharacterized protein n=1 Tax=Marininema mesophilum TaxID=1048340 RepID=A0A1H2W5D4_9BACL|nr:DUF1811 family protein [Marininema mesophilum]SDW75768.1 Protein of unknown function [Marininema mesophilum]
MQHFSRMNRGELLTEIRRLQESENQARRSSMIGEEAVIQQQIRFAKSYLTDPSSIHPGKLYKVEGEESLFLVEYLNGVMAWGNFVDRRIREAVPIGILSPNETDHS